MLAQNYASKGTKFSHKSSQLHSNLSHSSKSRTEITVSQIGCNVNCFMDMDRERYWQKGYQASSQRGPATCCQSNETELQGHQNQNYWVVGDIKRDISNQVPRHQGPQQELLPKLASSKATVSISMPFKNKIIKEEIFYRQRTRISYKIEDETSSKLAQDH